MKERKLLIFGAGGHGRVAAEIAERMDQYGQIVFADDRVSGTAAGFPVLCTWQQAKEYLDAFEVFAAVGDARIRQNLLESLECSGAAVATLIDPSAVVSASAVIEAGVVIMPGAIVNSCAHIGKGSILNTASSVDHDCVLGEYCHVAVGAHLCGTVRMGSHTWVGAGATVSNDLTICGGCMIGAGAVVVCDLPVPGTYLGVPARLQRKVKP